MEAADGRQEVQRLEAAGSGREVLWLEAADEAHQQKAGAAAWKTMAPASEEPRVESAAGDQKEVQGGCQLWPMEVSRLEETAAKASMEPAVAVPWGGQLPWEAASWVQPEGATRARGWW